MSFDTKVLTVVLPQACADAVIIPLMKAPSDANGGGITVMGVTAVEMADATQGAGTAYALKLFKYSSAGTPAVNGTISKANIGGTASPMAAGVPQSFTLDTSYTFLDAGEYLMLKYSEEGAATNPVACAVTVSYQLGR